MYQPINRKAQEKGIVIGSKVKGMFRLWGNEIPWSGTVAEVHNAVVSVRYDEPITQKAPTWAIGAPTRAAGNSPTILSLPKPPPALAIDATHQS